MSKVSKEFWVSDEHLDKINSDGEFSLVLRNKDESSFMDSVINKATNKITITYEIDRVVTIKESDIDRLFSNNTRFTYKDIEIMKRLFFGGGENEWLLFYTEK